MSLDKLGLTLYDFLGHLFPGFVVLFTLSSVEATFGESSILSFSAISENIFFSTVLAYFLGHMCNAGGALLKNNFRKFFRDEKERLNPEIFSRVASQAAEIYGLPFVQDKGNNLEVYQLAENWIDTSGVNDKKEVYSAMEGFYRATMVSVFLVGITALLSLLEGGIAFQAESGEITQISSLATIGLSAAAILASAVARKRFMFFNRLKINKTLLNFLASAIQFKAEHK